MKRDIESHSVRVIERSSFPFTIEIPASCPFKEDCNTLRGIKGTGQRLKECQDAGDSDVIIQSLLDSLQFYQRAFGYNISREDSTEPLCYTNKHPQCSKYKTKSQEKSK